MKKLSLSIISLIACLQITSAQVGSNKEFLASKGTWKYPVKQACILNKNCLDCNANNILTFLSDSCYPVTAVFDGVVVLITEYDNVFIVITKYGDYFLGYSNLDSTTVKKGDKLKAGDKIGYTGKNLDEIYCVDINLSSLNKDLDPSAWFVSEKPSQ